jgi:hypothetical protein
MNPALTVLLVLLVIAAIGSVVYLYLRDRKTKQLRARFGPEYSRAVNEFGDRRKAETSLERRAQRVKSLAIHPLAADESARYASAWRKIQAEFVDNPRDAVTHADALLNEVMMARGYPVTDFEQTTADLSVHYPGALQNYRAAHEIAVLHKRGEAGTEDLRQAMIHYRSLFEELIAETRPEPRHISRQPVMH